DSVAVQHHHAHVVSAMVEHGIRGHVIGVSFDGDGYGGDGMVWGGEFMMAERRYFFRRAHLKYVPMPGGDKAAEEPWRMAVSYLYSAYGDALYAGAPFFLERFDEEKIRLIVKIIQDRINSPLTSSAGRLFDAVSALLGIVDISTFEAEAAITLEKAAAGCKTPPGRVYPFEIKEREVIEVDATPLVKAICDDIKKGTDIPAVAAVFHNTVAEMIVETAKMLREESAVDIIVLSGGVFQNFILLKRAVERLKREGFNVYHNEKVPINDGGISMGQAVVAWENIKVLRTIRH
ncbi:MAG: carbamoyltransferase HypF, partial [Deltaproteobacteria bacterium]|nr:carbamoyltransferase HypF [Deltaproteobacteria bacterium]